MHKPITFWVGIAFAIIFLAIAVYYWVTPASELASFIPGYDAASDEIHFKHGLASAILALLAATYAWFQSAPKMPAIGDIA